MNLKALLLAVLLTLSTPAFAVDPVEVTADSFEIDDMTKNAVFTGSVVISRGSSLTVWADKVVVVYGSGGQSDMQSLTATGNVRIKTAQQNATGGQAVYDPGAQILRLTQNVTVTNAQGTVSGPELVLNLANNTTTFSGSEGGRVTGVFTPQ
ncbi:MAG: lipopolysaccharide transport periplasmic protein LptA [Devosia sp.]